MNEVAGRVHQEAFRLGEPSLADVICCIDRDHGAKRHWATSLRMIARYLHRPPESIPARISSIGAVVRGLNAERLGVARKTLANHRANLRAALLWFNKKADKGGRRELDAHYRDLLTALPSRHDRDVLSPFVRYLTHSKVALSDVRDHHVSAYVAHRTETSFAEVKGTTIRRLVRVWNIAAATVSGSLAGRLREPGYASRSSGPSWEDFPEGLRAGIEAFCGRISTRHKTSGGRTMRACSPTTVETRKRELIAAVRTAVEAGIPLQTLRSLVDLLDPDNVEVILDTYWRRNGKTPSLYTIDLAWKLVALARLEPDFDPGKLARLSEISDELGQYRMGGLTEKNRALVRQVLAGDIWRQVVQLPDRLMEKARRDSSTMPVKAGVTAALAATIRLLTLAPIRMQNLAAIEIGKNLVRPGGRVAPYLLTFPEYDVKNRVPLEFPLDDATTALLDEYVEHHRPNLMRGRFHNLLFPGDAADKKSAKSLSAQISDRLMKELGLKVTPHQFRHAAAALMLMHEPGNYELVRRVLGHRSIQTTINFYVGLESLSATRRFGELVTSSIPLGPSGPAPVRGTRRHRG